MPYVPGAAGWHFSCVDCPGCTQAFFPGYSLPGQRQLCTGAPSRARLSASRHDRARSRRVCAQASPRSAAASMDWAMITGRRQLACGDHKSCEDCQYSIKAIRRHSLGRVDGFDQDEAECERDERAIVACGLLASERDALELFELADRRRSCPCLVERFRKVHRPVDCV